MAPMIASQTSRKIAALLLLCASAKMVEAQSGKRLTREELIELREASSQRREKLEPQKTEETEKNPPKTSILDRSVVLGSGQNWTFVPKGAVMHLPEIHKNKVNLTEGRGRYLPFADFLAKNRGWVSTYDVTLEQARGNTPIGEEARKKLEKSDRVIISICKGGPISTRPSKASTTPAK